MVDKIRFTTPKPNWNGVTKWKRLYSELNIICCDCGLAHTFLFKIEPNGKMYWRAKRHKVLTKYYREKHKNKLEYER